MKKPLSKGSGLLVCLMITLLLLSACGSNNNTDTAPTPANRDIATPTAAATTAPTVVPSNNTIRIYSSMPLIGSSAERTKTMANAINMALDDFTNGTRKIGDFTLEYVSLDDATPAKGQWDVNQEKYNATKVANDPDAMVHLGPYNSDAAKVSIPVLNQANVPMISAANTLACLTHFEAASGCDPKEPATYYPNSTRNYFRVTTTDDFQAPAMASFIVSQNVKKVFLIDDSQAYGKAIADAFEVAAKKLNLEIVQRTAITGKEINYNELAATIKAKNAEFIVYAGITQNRGGKLLADVRAATLRIPFLGPDGILEDAFINDAGFSADGAYATGAGVDDSKLPTRGQDFLKRYRAKYGNNQHFTIYAYEAMWVALTAIKNVGKKDRAAILQAIANTKDYDGVLGKWSFDKNGDTTLTDFYVQQVKDGKWTFLTQTKAVK